MLLRPFLWVIELMGVVSMVSVEEVGVYIERDANASVPQLWLMYVVRPLLNQETGEGMPEVMEADMPQACSGETGLKGVADKFIADSLVCRADGDPWGQGDAFHDRIGACASLSNA